MSRRRRSRLPLVALILFVAVAAGVLVATRTTVTTGQAADASQVEAAPQPPVLAPDPPPPSPSPSPSPSPTPPPPPPSRPALVQQLHGLLAAPGVAGTWSVLIADEHGRVLVEREADAPLLPASTQKLVTAAAALLSLGPDHRFETELRATAPVSPDGTLSGDLVLVGGGDPALATPLYGEQVYPVRPRTPLEALADQVVAAGVSRVTGSVVGDPRVFGPEPDAPGWFPRYFHDLDARHVAGLTVDAGLDVWLDEAGELKVELAADPALRAAVLLRELLVERGVDVAGATTVAPEPPRAPTVLATVSSPPLVRLLEHMVERSDNHVADHVLHEIGREVLGDGSWTGGARAAHQVLTTFGLDLDGLVLADGSGLSRDNRATARLLGSLEAAMQASADAPIWNELMAVAGVEGTLRRRLVDTPAAGRLTGKTGTLEDVRAVVGTVHNPDGQRYHLVVIANDQVDPDSRVNVRALMDNLALALASAEAPTEAVASGHG